MIVYRYELEDGGGPYYYRNGVARNPSMPNFPNSPYLYGAYTISTLNMLFNNYSIDTTKMILCIYNTDKYYLNSSNGHIKFIPKQLLWKGVNNELRSK